MTKKYTIRERIRGEVIRAAARLYGAANYERWHTTKIYPEQIQAVWRMAYNRLAEAHPRMDWLQILNSSASKDLNLKLVLRVPGKDIEIDLPDKDRKLGAVSIGGGVDLLNEMLEIVEAIGINPPQHHTMDF